MGFALTPRGRSLRAYSCSGKLAFASEGAARVAASAHDRTIRRQRGRKGAISMNWYRCRFCEQWHLTRCRS